MKKINRIIIAFLVFLLVLPLHSVFAERSDDVPPFIMDYAPFFSDEEVEQLEGMAASIAEKYGMGAYIVTIENKGELDLADYSIEEIAEMIYDAWNLGVGDEKEGVLLLYSYDEPEFCVYSHGVNTEQIFTPSICLHIESSFIDSYDTCETWYDWFDSYLFDVEFELEWALNEGYPSLLSDSTRSVKTRSSSASNVVASHDGSPENIMDYAKILSSSSFDSLTKKASSLQAQYNMGIYIITIPNKSFVHANGYDIESLAEAIYGGWNLGVGDEKDGILLLMDMYEREFDICAHGTRGHYTFTDYGKDLLEKSFIDEFGEDDWYEGFDDYLDEIERDLIWAEKGDPVDYGSESEKLRQKIGIPGIVGISLLIGLFIAFCICSYFKAQMKSVRPAASAEDFANEKGIEYSEKVDNFIKSTSTTRIIESSSSKGGTSVSSGGYSHHSGKF